MSLNKSKTLRTAEKYVLQGKISAAIDEYRKVVDADPSDLTTINTLGDLYVRAGRIQDAIANFSRIAESYRESGFTLKAIAMLKKISKLDPTNVETAMKLANLYSQQGLVVEARQQYLQVADAYARHGQTRKALEAYQKIADLDPTNTSVRMKLGEIYSRENMPEQAHESYILAGAEFLRKGDTEQALNANLKAIAIDPESRQGLTAIAAIYTQLGQADRAINLLCEAFERNPGDVELLTILGRTYLAANMMDEAERTFLSLVELDKNRYHYLLEVGRRFLQMGDLDRAAEQIDGCLEVLIAKREEDKAIDFLRRILDRDMNHVGSLKRLAQIFQRIREDHNLITTLNSLAEAAMRKGDDKEAIAALKELAQLEPDEPMHLQRLYNLGVHDLPAPDAPGVVRATGPLDYQAAAFDDAFVIRQISEAEILAGHGQVEQAVTMLKEILVHAPENLQVHLKLKDIYLRVGLMNDAAAECVAIARIHEGRGESARASDYYAEAQSLNPLVAVPPPAAAEPEGAWMGNEAAFGFDVKSEAPAEAPGADFGFEMREATGRFDLSKYQTNPLNGAGSENGNAPAEAPPANGRSSQPFRFSDMLVGSQPEGGSPLFAGQNEPAPDSMSSVLRNELEGIDFYIVQGYVEIAVESLNRLRDEHGDHPEIQARYKRLGLKDSGPLPVPPEEAIPIPAPAFESNPATDPFAGLQAGGVPGLDMPSAGGDSLRRDPLDFNIAIPRSPKDSEQKNYLPMMIEKESAPLPSDLIFQLNTSELKESALSMLGQSPAKAGNSPTEDLLKELNATFDAMQPEAPAAEEQGFSFAEPAPADQGFAFSEPAPAEADLTPVEPAFSEPPAPAESAFAEPAVESRSEAAGFDLQEMANEIGSEPQPESQPEQQVIGQSELEQIYEELREETGGLKPVIDYETHFSLGIAYKDMDLFDDAIEQFQLAFRLSSPDDPEGTYIQCCHMLGLCFERKGMHKLAIMWFERGLKAPGRSEDEYQALRYEIALCHEQMGNLDRAMDVLMEVYGIDVNYRQVGEKIKQLQLAKK